MTRPDFGMVPPAVGIASCVVAVADLGAPKAGAASRIELAVFGDSGAAFSGAASFGKAAIVNAMTAPATPKRTMTLEYFLETVLSELLKLICSL